MSTTYRMPLPPVELATAEPSARAPRAGAEADEDDAEHVREHGERAGGPGERQLLEVVLAIAVKTISNYTNHLFDTVVDHGDRPAAASNVPGRRPG
jgi:alkylhydroperoxidase family enzyme